METRDRKTLIVLILVALGVQLLALAGVARLRGDWTAYAYQSPDSLEYVGLARGLARQGRYIQIDEQGVTHGGLDTWRMPGYPVFLAGVIRVFGDRSLTLILAQQVMAALSVALLFALVRAYVDRRWALAAALAWTVDPFRLYYSQWLMAETLFACLLILIAWFWARRQGRPLSAGWVLAMGALAGAIVLVRPIGIVIPPLLCFGILCGQWLRSPRRAVGLAIVGGLGVILALMPWMVRNRVLTGHFSLTHQSGASFCYHKVADVVLHDQGKSAYRFDAATLDGLRERMDECLHEKWEARFGSLTPAQREALTWRKLNFGQADGIDAFAASSLLWSVGLEMLADRKVALLECFSAQGINMLVFPLGLLIDPPAGEGSSPLSMLGRGGRMANCVAGGIGLAYAVLALAVLGRLAMAAWRRVWPGCFFVILPVLGLFVLTLPFEDPRFRLPLVPFFWLIVLAGRSVPPTCEKADDPLK